MTSATPPVPPALQSALQRLDPEQRHASETMRAMLRGELPHRRCKVLACAGAGKTGTITTTVAAALLIDGIEPSRLPCVTFTRKAGQEMAQRIAPLCGGVLPQGLYVGTWHSLARRKLAAVDPERWSMDRNLDIAKHHGPIPTAYEIWDSIIGWRRDGVYGSGAKSLDIGGDAGDYALVVDRLIGRGFTVHGNDEKSESETRRACRDTGLPRLHAAWALYEGAKHALGVWDFSDSIRAWTALAAESIERERYRGVVVDEAQDNNVPQNRLLRALNPDCMIRVGDGSQAIFGFRGASLETFLQDDSTASDDLPELVLYIPNNYRSASAIVDLSNEVSAHLGEANGGLVARTGRAPGDTPSALRHEVPVQGLLGEDPLSTAYAVAHRIREFAARGLPLRDVAILLRTNNAAALYEGALMHNGLPAVRWGGDPFWERRDVLGFLGYAIIAASGTAGTGITDAHLVAPGGAFRRCANQPNRFLSRDWQEAVCARVNRGEPLPDAIRAEAHRAKGKSRARANDLADLITKLQRHTWPHSVHLIQDVLTRALPSRESERPDEERKGVPKTCAAIAKRFSTALEFYHYAAQAAANAQRSKGELPQGKVVLATVHSFKGLERPVVFVPIDEGLFPHARSQGDKEAMAEEYRLAYVAFTRARDVLCVVASQVGLDGETRLGPSEFVKMLPEHVANVLKGSSDAGGAS